MPFVNVNGAELYYAETGTGPETVVFSHGFLMNNKMFAHQIDALSAQYRVIAYDHRGHGQSAPYRAPFGMRDLVDDAAALIDILVGGPVHFAGMSTGGFVGTRLALRRQELIKSLTLIDTAADAEDPATLRQYKLLLFAVRWMGTRSLLGKVMPIMMAQPYLSDPAHAQEIAQWRADWSALDNESIYRFGKAIFSRNSVLSDLAALKSPPPTQIIVGSEDAATPVAQSRAMQAALKDARLKIIPSAGHSSPVEAPQAVTNTITDFLEQLGAA